MLLRNDYDIFLGGTCSGSAWREDFLKLIEEKNPKIRCFNPIVDNWTKECIDLENFVKYHSKYHIYVITPNMVGVYSIAEMVDSVHDKTKKVYFYIQDTDIDSDGNTITWKSQEKNSLNAVANMLILHGAYKSESLEDMINKIVNDFNNTQRPKSNVHWI